MASLSTRRQGYDKYISTAGLAAVPTSNTSVSTTDTLLYQLAINNPTAAGITLTITTGAASPITLMSVTVPANSSYAYNWEEAVLMVGGVKWQAGGVGLTGELVGFAKQSAS